MSASCSVKLRSSGPYVRPFVAATTVIAPRIRPRAPMGTQMRASVKRGVTRLDHLDGSRLGLREWRAQDWIGVSSRRHGPCGGALVVDEVDDAPRGKAFGQELGGSPQAGIGSERARQREARPRQEVELQLPVAGVRNGCPLGSAQAFPLQARLLLGADVVEVALHEAGLAVVPAQRRRLVANRDDAPLPAEQAVFAHEGCPALEGAL